VEQIAQRYADIPIIGISGHPREDEVPLDQQGRQQPFLMKPVAPDALLDTVARMLSKTPNGTTQPGSGV
jgi:DNA-binding NtrC family response regulator